MRYAVRLLLKNRGPAAAAVLSLALGIGGNTLMFSIVHAVLIRSLPYPESDRLVFVWFTPPKHPDQKRAATAATFLALRERSGPLEHIGVVGGVEDTATLTAPGNIAEQVEGQKFSAGVPDALDAKPLLGRWFTDVEASPAIVIGYRLWQRHFAGASGILGKTVRIDGELMTIVGVMPEGWTLFNSPAQFWTPYRLSPADRKSSNRIFPLIARLKRGKSLRQAQEQMNGIAAGLAEQFPSTNKGWGIRLEPAADLYTGWVRQPLLIVQGVVLLVLLIACANVTGLLLVEAESRKKEVAVRAALGAGRWRIIRQFLIESVLLSTLGGLCGAALAYGGVKLFIAISPPWFPRLGEIVLDARMLGFTAVLSLATALVFGLIPALQLSRPDLIGSLKQTRRGAAIGIPRQRLRGALVVMETSLALVLLIGAGLMLNTSLRLYDSPSGCDCRGLLTFQVQLPKSRFVKNVRAAGGDSAVEISPRVNAIFEQIRERVSGMARVRSVAAGVRPALSADALDALAFNFTIESHNVIRGQTPSAAWFPVSAGYFHTLGVPLLRGREFGIEDTGASMPVVVINEAMARRFWSNEDPIGKRLRIEMVNEPSRQIVGVVGNVRHNRRDRDASPEMYVPYVQHPPISQSRFVEPRLTMIFIVRTFGDPFAIVPSVRAAVAEVDRNVPIFNVKTMDAYAAEQLWQPKQTTILLSIFGGVALVLVMAGIYGLVAYAVRRRTPEIGIRMALGASRKDILCVVIAQGLLLVALGTAIGLAGALALTRVLQAMLWGVTPADLRTYVIVVAALIFAAAPACYLPARKALAIEPAAALRHE